MFSENFSARRSLPHRSFEEIEILCCADPFRNKWLVSKTAQHEAPAGSFYSETLSWEPFESPSQPHWYTYQRKQLMRDNYHVNRNSNALLMYYLLLISSWIAMLIMQSVWLVSTDNNAFNIPLKCTHYNSKWANSIPSHTLHSKWIPTIPRVETVYNAFMFSSFHRSMGVRESLW